MRTALRSSIPVHDLVPGENNAWGSLLLVERITDETAFHTPHRHAFTQLLLVEAGIGTHLIDAAEVPVRAGEVHLLVPGQVHEWRVNPGLRCIAVMFSEDVLDSMSPLPERLREALLLGAAPIALDIFGEDRFRRLFRAIEEAPSLASAKHLLAALLCDCALALPATPTASRRSSFTGEFLREVFRAPDARNTVANCAERLGVTTGYLAEQVVADTGSTPGRILRSAVAREAQRLLSGTELSAAQISTMLGFNEASYFSRFFRREVGCTPTEYRQHGIDRGGRAKQDRRQAELLR